MKTTTHFKKQKKKEKEDTVALQIFVDYQLDKVAKLLYAHRKHRVGYNCFLLCKLYWYNKLQVYFKIIAARMSQVTLI